jgi:hypothetical protein
VRQKDIEPRGPSEGVNLSDGPGSRDWNTPALYFAATKPN